jgi:hypothetical protein
MLAERIPAGVQPQARHGEIERDRHQVLELLDRGVELADHGIDPCHLLDVERASVRLPGHRQQCQRTLAFGDGFGLLA